MNAKERLEIIWDGLIMIIIPAVIYYSVRAVWKVGFGTVYWLSVGSLIIAAAIIAAIAFIFSFFVNLVISFFERCLKSR